MSTRNEEEAVDHKWTCLHHVSLEMNGGTNPENSAGFLLFLIQI